MAILAWVMMGLAVWHFAIWVPDRFVGGIVGAIVFGFLVNGLTVPSRDDVDVLTALEGIPGSIIGMGIAWFIGNAREGAEPATT